jgi:membrane protein implicated in regulation of membrane protease activity
MMRTLLAYGPWTWLVIGVVLLAIELVAPGVFMLWLGLAAILVGVVSFAVDWTWQSQIIAFVVFSIAAVPLWRRLSRGQNSAPSEGFLNRRADAFVGRVFTLEKPIVDGAGTVRINDSIWRVSGPDAPAGSRVKVVSSDGGLLTVESA